MTSIRTLLLLVASAALVAGCAGAGPATLEEPAGDARPPPPQVVFEDAGPTAEEGDAAPASPAADDSDEARGADGEGGDGGAGCDSGGNVNVGDGNCRRGDEGRDGGDP